MRYKKKTQLMNNFKLKYLLRSNQQQFTGNPSKRKKEKKKN